MGSVNLSWQYKPKWRQMIPDGVFHCFVRATVGGKQVYESLCCRHTLQRAGGGSCNRPPAILRCALCDAGEMDLLKLEESADTLPNWRDALIGEIRRGRR